MSVEDEEIEIASFTKAGWTAKRIRITPASVELEGVIVAENAEAMRNFSGTMSQAIKKVRPRTGSGQSRYAALPADAPARKLSQEAADFLDDQRMQRVGPKTIKTYQLVFRLLTLAAGDIAVSEINADHIRSFWDVLRWWPPQAGNSKIYRDMTDAQILEAGKQANCPPRAADSLNSFKKHLRSFFARLVEMRVISHSPLAGFRDFKGAMVSTGRRRPFTQEELVRVFDHDHFVPWAMKYPHRWWGPMIALYTGARASEIAQLKKADVIQESGMWCLSFRKTPDAHLVGNAKLQTLQQLKGQESIRTIPIAQPLLDAGFIDFLDDANQIDHPRLFPHLLAGMSRETKLPNGNGYGEGLIAQFAKYLKDTHQIGKGVALHAFRHLLITTLDDADVDIDLIASITGHAIDRSKRKRKPVIKRHYAHGTRTLTLRQKQLAALEIFEPGVVLPKYRQGQFALAYKQGKLHP